MSLIWWTLNLFPGITRSAPSEVLSSVSEGNPPVCRYSLLNPRQGGIPHVEAKHPNLPLFAGRKFLKLKTQRIFSLIWRFTFALILRVGELWASCLAKRWFWGRSPCDDGFQSECPMLVYLCLFSPVLRVRAKETKNPNHHLSSCPRGNHSLSVNQFP